LSLNKVLAAIERHDNFLITSHIDPEGDSLGSQLALAQLLKAKKKNYIVVNHSPIPRHYKFLPFLNMIKKPSKQLQADVVLILDCPEINRIGGIERLISNDSLVVNIDHHISNKRFADINWVEPNTSCTAEMIYKLYQCFNIKLDKKIALCLYVGILVDTGSFHYSNTSTYTHRLASQLLKFNIKPAWVYEQLYENMAISDLRLFSLVLDTVKTDSTGKIAWIKLTQRMLKRTKTKVKEGECFIGKIRALQGVKLAIFFRETEEKDKIKVSLRSKGDVDVNKIAQIFGGGGHKAASGLTIKGSLNKAEELVIGQVKKIL
jgi:phosphoesterase RecJ-like protein